MTIANCNIEGEYQCNTIGDFQCSTLTFPDEEVVTEESTGISCKPPNRIYNQYSNSLKAKSWFEASYTIGEQFCDAANLVAKSYDIDSNSGAQLDVIGRVVVQDREYADKIELDAFQCNTDGEYQCNADGDNQCSSLSVADDKDLSDEYYKLLLKAKIAKNNNDATMDGILNAITVIAPDADFRRVSNGQDMTMSVEFYGNIDPIARLLLVSGELIPVPQGVLLKGVLEGIGMAECNNEGDYQCNTDGEYECVGFLEI